MAGKYFDMDSTTFIDIEFQDGKLKLWGYDLLPVSERNLIFAAYPTATVDFSEGEPATVHVDTGTTQTRYVRVEPAQLIPAPPGDYTGTYYSPELDVTWTITEVDGNSSGFGARRQGSSILTPTIADVFTDDWVGSILHGSSKPMALAFERDDNHTVRGFRISDAAGRVRNLAFERIAPTNRVFSPE